MKQNNRFEKVLQILDDDNILFFLAWRLEDELASLENIQAIISKEIGKKKKELRVIEQKRNYGE